MNAPIDASNMNNITVTEPTNEWIEFGCYQLAKELKANKKLAGTINYTSINEIIKNCEKNSSFLGYEYLVFNSENCSLFLRLVCK